MKKHDPMSDESIQKANNEKRAEQQIADCGLSDKEFYEAYTCKVERPKLNPQEWVLDAHARGLSLSNIVQSSLLSVRAIYKLLGLDPVLDHEQFDKLVKSRDHMRPPALRSR